MTTIVKHRRTGNEYILLGINGEANKVNPSRFISELFNQEKSEVSCSATVCDVQGNMFLAYIDDLIVMEVDGIKPAEILPAATYEASAEPVDGDSRSPSSEFVEDDFEDDFESENEEEYEEEYEDELDTSADATNVSDTPAKPYVRERVGESLDAPSPDQSSDDEDWI
ncbi:MAG: hypothetical protein ACRC1Z_17400 [Waterburya sp.]